MEIRKITLIRMKDVQNKMIENYNFMVHQVCNAINGSIDMYYSVEVEEYNFATLVNFYSECKKKINEENNFCLEEMLLGTDKLKFLIDEFDCHVVNYTPVSKIYELIRECEQMNVKKKLKEINLAVGKWLQMEDALLDIDDECIDGEKREIEKCNRFYKNAMENKEDVICIIEYM